MKTPARSLLLCLTLAVALGLSAQTATPTASAAEPVELEKFLVQDQAVENYRATDALTGTKTGAALRDLPFVLSVVPRELIEDRRFTFLGEALDQVAGAQRKLGYGGVQNFGAFLRGFDSGFTTLRNGFRDFGFYTLRDTANVERYEILKGPASLLYGSLQPGGITHTLTKQPLAQRYGRATLVAGDFDFLRGELDVGGPLSSSVFYRLNLAAEEADSFRDGVGSRSQFVAPVLSWFLSEQTRLTVEVEYKRAEYTWDLGLPRDVRSLTVPTSRFLGEPDARNDVESAFVSSVLEHQFNANWKLRQNLGAAYSGGDYQLRSPIGIAADSRTVTRTAYGTNEHSENHAIQHELVGSFDLGATRHQAIVGLDLTRTLDAYDFEGRALASIDLLAPSYGAQPGAPSFSFGNEVTRDGFGVYFQDLMAIRDDVKVLFGARYDSIRHENYDRVAQALARVATDAAVSPQVGVVYQPLPATSLYASYSTSFLPVPSGRTASGSFLDPEEGEQVELGVKQELLGGRASATLATFWITKENVSTPDPVLPTFRLQTGEQKSRGVELELNGQLLPGWSVMAAAAYLDAFVSRDNAIPVGAILPGAPEWSGSVWSKYAFAAGPLKGLSLGAGVFSAAKRKAALPNAGWWLPSYTRVDAMLGYTRDRWGVQLNVKNLTDDRIYDLTGTTIMPQAPRSFLVSTSYTFRRSPMLWIIARHEMAQLWRDGRLRVAFAAGLALIVALVGLGWQDYRRDRHERAHFESTARAQWENQGEKHPHRAAHFGIYLAKPELPLALFDSGIKAAAGQVLFLEAHQRSMFTYSPVEDAGAAAMLGLTNGAEVLQLLGALLIVLAVYGSIAREREDGTLRLVLAQGVSPRTWFAGKCLGMGLGLGAIGVPVALVVVTVGALAQPGAIDGNLVVRTAALLGGHLVYFLIWLLGALAVSCRAATARTALALLLAWWVGAGVLAPRVASSLASLLAPVPAVAEFARAQAADFNAGFDGEPGWDERLAALEQATLARYGVKTVAELPVGFSGIRLREMDAFTDRISDRHHRRLEAIYTRQTRWQLLTALLGPFVPMRAFSQSAAGMDWAHYRHFAEAAEGYRRELVETMDRLMEHRLRGEQWELKAGHEVWSQVRPFAYELPGSGWALVSARWPLALLAGWLAVVTLAAWTAARRIAP